MQHHTAEAYHTERNFVFYKGKLLCKSTDFYFTGSSIQTTEITRRRLTSIGFTCGHLYVWHLKRSRYTRAAHKETELKKTLLKHDKKLIVVMDQIFQFMGQTYGQHEGSATGGTTSCY
jgi:hypothetical protein